MKQWKLDYWCSNTGKSPIERWLDNLTTEQLKTVAKEMSLLEKCGNDLKMPHSRSLGKGLFELREQKFGYRVYYCFCDNKLIVLLAAGDKSSQTNDIKVARQRLNENDTKQKNEGVKK